MLLITFAHPSEAQPSLTLLGAKQLTPTLYSTPSALIEITGMGPGAHPRTQDITEIWNLGLAGALDPTLRVGQICPISQVSFSDGPPLSLSPTGHTLFTSPRPIWGERPSTTAQLVDMEGYPIARAAHAHNIPCHLWKIVSDHTERGGSPTLLSRLPTLAQKLAHFLTTRFTQP